ncbi:hypothetical protein [Gynuella sunshinyii]|uniref:Uncharacterized protein n=1 Tax=Gynuella sunshinyii YC6258 TaxID=1445510 RepID=A0A0C5VP51_9GAMM|nr:hypothetical protein [Gynuella sunshinyii]AJQ96437.1 hypothetical Protein YC6258_04405 [Gynuella sunshinyii YC6258]
MRRFLKTSFFLILIVMGLLFALGLWVSDARAVVQSKPALNFSDLKRMQALWEKYQPGHLKTGSRYVLDLTERESNLALALLLAQYGVDENLNIRVESTVAGVVTHLSYPLFSSTFRYLNLDVVWQVIPGEFPSVTSISLSNLSLPDAVIRYVNRRIRDRVPESVQDQWQKVRLSIVPTSQGVSIGLTWFPLLSEQLVTFDTTQEQMKASKFLKVIHQVNTRFEDRSEIAEWLAAVIDAARPGSEDLKVFLTVIAQYVAGNSVNSLFDLKSQDPAAIRFYLSGHRDLARHFVFSALLAAQTTADSAKQVGLFKELSDSDNKDSGYSGIDLLANQAGISFYLLLVKAIESDQLELFVENLKNRPVMLDRDALRALDSEPREFWSQSRIDELLASIPFFR